MRVYDTPDIRNVVMIGHGGSGKTTLTSALLFAGGAVKRMGRVDDGSATTDYDEEEIARKISLQTGVAYVEYKNRKVNLIDGPGYAAFLADTKVAMRAAEAACLLVDAVAGVEIVTERVFGYAKDFDMPVIFVVNKMDRENASFQRTVDSIHERFGRHAVPLQIPLGKESGYEGVVDLITMKAYRYAMDDSGKVTAEDIPADLLERATETRGAMMEMIAETDDKLMETYFEKGDLTPEEMALGLRKAVAKHTIYPVFCASALHVRGTQQLLDALVDLVPAPGDRGEAVGVKPGTAEELRRKPVPDAPVSVFVFKTLADPFAGKQTLFRVMSGTLKADSNVVNVRRDDFQERLGQLSVMQGKQTETVPELRAGDIGVLAKLKETQTCDTLSDPSAKIEYPPVTFREPAISYAVEIRSCASTATRRPASSSSPAPVRSTSRSRSRA